LERRAYRPAREEPVAGAGGIPDVNAPFMEGCSMKFAMAVALGMAILAPRAGVELGKETGDCALGKEMSLAALKKEGKVVAVYFWSQDCPFGPPQFSRLKETAAKFAGDKKVQVVAVSAFGEPSDKAVAWAKDNDLKCPMVFDEGKVIARFFGARKVNSTYVIDAKGVLVYRGGFEPIQEAIQAAVEGKDAPKSDGEFKGCPIKS
jgi:peroxiredoxin